MATHEAEALADVLAPQVLMLTAAPHSSARDNASRYASVWAYVVNMLRGVPTASVMDVARSMAS